MRSPAENVKFQWDIPYAERFPSTVVRSDGLVARFGPDIALPDLLVEIAVCERRADFSRPCGARFTDLASH